MSVRKRSYQLTFNNPQKHHYTHDIIKDLMKNFNWKYYCMCDETGEQGTYHTHLFFYCENAISQEKVKKVFPTVHIEMCNGSCRENRDYIRKEGKYANSEKKETNHPETFEEYGEMPVEKVVKNESVYANVLEMIKSGKSDSEIIDKYPSFLGKISQLDKARQVYLFEEFKHKNREVYVEYIFGATGTGKTYFVLDKYGNDNVYKITNYKNPFDEYIGEDVILFDEYHSQLFISDMLQFLDKYPCRLPARYGEKYACYTKVYVVSNLPFDSQYDNIKLNKKDTYNAFVRRFNKITQFIKKEDLPFETDEFSSKIDLSVEQFYI